MSIFCKVIIIKYIIASKSGQSLRVFLLTAVDNALVLKVKINVHYLSILGNLKEHSKLIRHFTRITLSI